MFIVLLRSIPGKTLESNLNCASLQWKSLPEKEVIATIKYGGAKEGECKRQCYCCSTSVIVSDQRLTSDRQTVCLQPLQQQQQQQ